MTNVTKSSTEIPQTVIVKLLRYLCILATIAISLAFIYTYFDQTLPGIYYDNISAWYSPIVATIAFIAIFLRALTSPKGANSRKAYFGITLAVLFYFLGEFTWSIQYVLVGSIADNVPYPSISDIFWAIGTVFFIDELFFMVSVIKVKFSKKQLTAMYGLTFFSVVGLILFIFKDVIFASYSSDNTPFMKAMNLYYFTGDVLILFATLYVTFGLFSKTGFKLNVKHLSFIFLILGNFSMILGDTFYAYFYTYYPNNLTLPFGSFFTLTFINNGFSVDNLFYMFQYMFWALSFIFFPSYLMRSFPGGQAVVTEEFVPIETKKNMDFTVPSVSDALSKEKATIVNTLGLDIGSHDSQPNSDQIQDQRSN